MLYDFCSLVGQFSPNKLLNMFKHLSFFLLLLFQFLINSSAYSQGKSISITIDDVPNIGKYTSDGFQSILLNRLDSLDVPFTVFINEENLFKSGDLEQNKFFLKRWIEHENSMVGNHGYSHLRYSDVDYDRFTEDIQKGALITKEYVQSANKILKHFRFPFNDLGSDSIHNNQIRTYLHAEGYEIAPFTVESSDWMFNSVYRQYLKSGEIGKAKEIGEAYVSKTLALVDFFEEMGFSLYGRAIKQIYLCHDNDINADFLPLIIQKLKEKGFVIESFEESLSDPVYQQKDRYYEKWGISWLYRWMDSQEERIKWMKREPDLEYIQEVFDQVSGN